MLRRTAVFIMLLPVIFVSTLIAQQNIQYLEDRKLFVLQSGDSTYAFGLNERNELQSVYWGAHLDDPGDLGSAHIRREWASFDLSTNTTPQKYPGWGAALFNEPALKVTFASGNRDLVLHYVSHSIHGNELEVVLK